METDSKDQPEQFVGTSQQVKSQQQQPHQQKQKQTDAEQPSHSQEQPQKKLEEQPKQEQPKQEEGNVQKQPQQKPAEQATQKQKEEEKQPQPQPSQSKPQQQLPKPSESKPEKSQPQPEPKKELSPLQKCSQGVTALLKEYQNHPGFNKTSDTGNLQLFFMEIDGTIASKGVSKAAFPINEVHEFVSNPQGLQQLDPDCEICKQVKIDQPKNEQEPMLIYMQYRAPWPVAWRDFITVVGQSVEEGGNKVYQGVRSCDHPYPEQKKIVRGNIVVGGWILEKIDDLNTKVTYMANVDIKGSVPQMIKNSQAKSKGSVAGKVEQYMKKSLAKKK